MLVPGVGGLATDQNMHSFVAALNLGLRRKFGGEIGHLRTMECEYPILETSRRRKYLLLYDTVPGGTGYLKDRMTDPDKLRSIFEAAQAALRECACVQDPEKDGCYRCIFAYRRSRDMPTTSRRVAERLVAATLKRWSEPEVVEGADRRRRQRPDRERTGGEVRQGVATADRGLVGRDSQHAGAGQARLRPFGRGQTSIAWSRRPTSTWATAWRFPADPTLRSGRIGGRAPGCRKTQSG